MTALPNTTPHTYKELGALLGQGEWSEVAFACDLIVGEFELETKAWFIGSCAYQQGGELNRAKTYIETALLIEPLNPDFLIQFFMICSQLDDHTSLAHKANQVFDLLPKKASVAVIGFIDVALKTALVHKMELRPQILAAVLKLRSMS